MARILNKPASIVEKGSTWQGCVDFFFYIYIHNNNEIFYKVMQKFPYQHDVVEYGQASHKVVLTSLNLWVCSNCLFSSHKTNTHIQFANKCSTNIVSYLISYCNKY